MTTRFITSLALAMLMTTVTWGQGNDNDNRGRRGGRGGWNPALMQQRMLERLQETLAVQDAEWTVVKPRLEAVMTEQRELRELSFRGFGFGRRGGHQAESPEPIAAVEKAIEADDAEGIKTALTALREARATQQVELTKAQTSLREVLTQKQEAQLVLMGMLE